MRHRAPIVFAAPRFSIQRLRQFFADRSLRTKLILPFLAMTVLSVGGVAFFANQTTQTALTDQVGANLASLAQQHARAIATHVNSQIDFLQAFSLSETVQDGVELDSNSYNDASPEAIRAKIEKLDRQWIAAGPDDALIQSHLNNRVASELKEFQSTFADNIEVFATDKYGALVAATSRVSDYNQADEEWWQIAYNGGHGAIYLGQPQYDESSKTTSMVIALPVYAHGTRDIVGVIRTSLNINALVNLLTASRFGQTGDTSVLLPGNRLLRSDGTIAPADAGVLAQLQQSSHAAYVQERQDGVPRLLSFAPVAAQSGRQAEAITKLGWTLLVGQDSAEALQPVNAAVRTMLVSGLGALLGALLLAFIIAQLLSAPIKRLTVVALQIASGDLNRRIDLRQRDEIGLLASGFNTMAEVLEQRVAAEQEGRQRLEDAVAHHLAFVQQVAQGDLSQRLPLRHDGALGQLSQGLNGMVESLHRMTRQSQQATAAIAAAAAEILAATTQQAASAAEQSAAITQTTTTIEEVKAIAVQTAQQASQVAEDGQGALSVARQGALSVEQTVSGMQQIRARVESIAATILALAEQTQAIGTIITTVSELADQSNLLALNAAIEAARAGEQGRSFAVVAQHVRALAERSKGATAQVREILGEIQKATNAAVLVTEEGTKGVEAGGKLAQQAGQVIHQIAGEVESGAQASVQIAAAAAQQTAGMEQIGQAMGSIQQATTQALTSTRQAERAAQDLHTLAQSLQQAIAAYRL